MASIMLIAASLGAWVSCAAAYCDTYTALSGEFQSPNYPSKYWNSMRCNYTFDTGYPIIINCPEFVLQSRKGGLCKRDYFTINDAGTLTAFCGTTGPSNYVSTGSLVTAEFKSNKKIRKYGFNCTYESIVDTTTVETTTPQETTTQASALLTTATGLYNSNTCYTSQRSTCGCSVTYDDSEFYTTVLGDVRIVVANGIPGHVYEVGQENANPNNACPHEVYMAVPVNPVKGNTYVAYGMGPVGIATSGAFFYNHLSTPSGDTAVISEGESFDTCSGHSDMFCRYHYHMRPSCIAEAGSCTLVGYMRDGFSVYSSCLRDSGSDYLRSCYQDNGTGDGSHTSHYTFNQTAYDNGDCDLDMANGYTFSDDRGYAYIFTEDYPFIMTGYYGTELADICYLEDA
ncbi:uncharacterized protein LOC119595717 [Penaeus monodon]|uniref:uncharacterized protein LOC119595717 n=1 Tax=Penaeus monodon TaxID=6687 RepID=UPI0018A762B1|nr:uncharacterized protein LOC119595717 [Penaeus monodon]